MRHMDEKGRHAPAQSISCDVCGQSFMRKRNEINRARRRGRGMYCSRPCMASGLKALWANRTLPPWRHRDQERRAGRSRPDQCDVCRGTESRDRNGRNPDALRSRPQNRRISRLAVRLLQPNPWYRTTPIAYANLQATWRRHMDRTHRDERGKISHAKSKVAKVMREYKENTLHSGSKKGPKVKSRKQAIAIAMSEARDAAHGKRKK